MEAESPEERGLVADSPACIHEKRYEKTKVQGRPNKSITDQNSGYKTSYTYDNLGRMSSNTEKIEGIDYTYNYYYDGFGNVSDIIYPDGFAVTNTYDDNGYFKNVASGNNNIWTAMQMTSTGKPERDLLGNNVPVNYSYDYYDNLNIILTGTVSDKKQFFMYNTDPTTGNMSWRKDMVRNLIENFTYDNLNRLTSATLAGHTPVALTYQPNGNIASKDDAGNYAYHPVQIHAVTELTGNPGTVPENDQLIEYTSFNKVKKITEVGLFKNEFIYGPDEERRVSILTDPVSNALLQKKVYVGSYEVVTDGTTEKKYHYINGSNGPVAIVITENGNDTYYYLCKDHLGSITGLLDQNGNMQDETNFDAWGRRRDPATWQYYTAGTEPAHILDRGFTFHEHMDKFGLINMNGRLYDPLVGRMLSPDPVMQAAGSTQGLNRYSYCFNNPLKYVDPSGNSASAGVSNPYLSVNNQLQNENYNWYNYMTSNFSDNLYWTPGNGNAGFYGYGSTVEKEWNDFFNRPRTISEKNSILMSSWKESVRNRISKIAVKGGWGAYVNETSTSTPSNLSSASSDGSTLAESEGAYAAWYSFKKLFNSFRRNEVFWANDKIGWVNTQKALAYGYSIINKIHSNEPFSINFNRGIPQIETNFTNKDWGAITPGNIIIYRKGGSKSTYYNTHEPGHVLQFILMGPLYYPLVGAPSLSSATFFPQQHSMMPWEMSANQLWFYTTGESDPLNPLYPK